MLVRKHPRTMMIIAATLGIPIVLDTRYLSSLQGARHGLHWTSTYLPRYLPRHGTKMDQVNKFSRKHAHACLYIHPHIHPSIYTNNTLQQTKT